MAEMKVIDPVPRVPWEGPRSTRTATLEEGSA
jgi:hypothetical protein